MCLGEEGAHHHAIVAGVVVSIQSGHPGAQASVMSEIGSRYTGLSGPTVTALFHVYAHVHYAG